MREGWRWSTVPPGTRFCFCLSVSVSLYLFLSLCLYLVLSLPLSLILSLHLCLCVPVSLSISVSLLAVWGRAGRHTWSSPQVRHQRGSCQRSRVSFDTCRVEEEPSPFLRLALQGAGSAAVYTPAALGTRWGMNAVSLSAPVSARECSGMPTAAFGGQPALQGPVTFSLENSQTPPGLGALAVAVASWAPLGLGTGPSGRHWAGTGPPSLTLDLLSGEE